MVKHCYVSSTLGLLMAGALFIAGCGRGGDDPQPGATPPTSASVSPPSTSPASPSPPRLSASAGVPRPTSTFSGTKTPGLVTVRGQVEEGVEAGCLLLRADNGGSYLLLGGDRAVISTGGRLEVVGRTEPGLVTTCQQGTPLQVEQVRRL